MQSTSPSPGPSTPHGNVAATPRALLTHCCCPFIPRPALHTRTRTNQTPQELDEQLYEECRQQYEQEQQLAAQKEGQRQAEWQAMQTKAQKTAAAKGLPNGVVNCNATYQPLLIRSKS
jgi:hypothetical protein